MYVYVYHIYVYFCVHNYHSLMVHYNKKIIENRFKEVNGKWSTIRCPAYTKNPKSQGVERTAP